MRANFQDMICDARAFVYKERHPVRGFILEALKHQGPSLYWAAAEAGPAFGRSKRRDAPARLPPE